MVSKDLVAASATPLVLSLLSHGDNYGYDTIQRVRELSDGRLEWSDGMLYPVLHRLEKSGFITADWRAGDTGRRRRYYKLSSKGARELVRQREDWQAVNQSLTRLWRLKHV